MVALPLQAATQCSLVVVDVQIQLIVTPYKYIAITSTLGLEVVQDHGDSGELIGSTLFGMFMDDT